MSDADTRAAAMDVAGLPALIRSGADAAWGDRAPAHRAPVAAG